MKYFSIAILLLLNTTEQAVAGSAPPPFRIHGQLKNFSSDELILFFKDPGTHYRDYTIDTIQVASDGTFSLQTTKIKTAVFATLRHNELSLDLYAAPGYDLKVEGDVKDIKQFHLHKSIDGKGAEANQFLFALDSLSFAKTAGTPWYEMQPDSLLLFIREDERDRNRLYQRYFSAKKTSDSWFPQFAKMALWDNKFMKLYYLYNAALQNPALDYKGAVALVRSNFDNNILDHLFKDEYMISSNYAGWLMYIYPYYLKQLRCLKDSSSCKGKNEKIELIEQIATHFKGPVRELKLYHNINSAFTYCRSFEELNLYKKELPKFIDQLKSDHDKQKILELIATMDTTLLRTQIGGAAPAFSATDSTGNSFSIDQYKGKVVYIDLWASWCAPCRYETPFLQKLVNKYKHNSSMQFISIAVMDQYEKWKAALIKDQPDWLQLFDQDTAVRNAYVANSIPKFILVNKKGNIVSFDAPSPSSQVQLEKLLEEELAK